MSNLKSYIRDISDFPQKGIVFKDITPLLENSKVLKETAYHLVKNFKNLKIDKVVGIESRGFIFATLCSYLLDAGLVIVRKHGKLPYKTINASYELEYGKDTLEIHIDAIKKDEKILIVDDLLATGGTISAVTNLIESLKGQIIGINFLIELTFLNGREKLKKYNVNSLITY